MKTYYKLIIIFLVITCSCTNKKEQYQQIEVVKSVNFKTGLSGLACLDINYCYDKNLKKDFVFFAKMESFIKSFDLDGNLIDSISLKKYIGTALEIPLCYSVYTIDTIVIYPYRKNLLAFINNNGEILKSYYINDLLEDSIKNDFWYRCYRSPYSLETTNKLYIPTIQNFREVAEKKFGIKEVTLQQDHKYYYTQWMLYTYLLEITNFLDDTVTANLILSDYYKTTYPEGDMNSYADKNYFYSNENHLFMMNSCQSKITMFDTKNYQKIKEINVTSKYTKMGLKPFYCPSEDYPQYSQQVTKYSSYAYGPRISRMFYNNKTKQYYVILTHELKNIEEWESLNNGDYRPFSVVIYDEDFENPKEYAFAAHTYIGTNCFISEEGLWLQRKPEKLTKENYGTQTFDLLKFN